jgi:hypothetical protein
LSRDQSRLADAEFEQQKAADRIRQADEKAEEDRRVAAENDPINKAIRQHHLVEGMSYDQAVQSMGHNPYSITQSGGVVEATWRAYAGEGLSSLNEFWSAVFVDDKATAVSHSVF